MKILFTGANGFVGRNAIPKLELLGFEVKKLNRNTGDYIADLSVNIPIFNEYFDIVFHAAGKAHVVPKTVEEKKDFILQNFQGTVNLCESLEQHPPKYFYYVSTVAVYGVETGEYYDENTPLRPVTPYGLSKLQAEQFLQKWSAKHGVILYILRPSLIFGCNAPGNLGDMISAIRKNRYFNIGKGDAKKSTFWVEDFADFVKTGLDHNGGVYNLCDDRHPSFYEISSKICSDLGRSPVKSLPLPLVKLIGKVGDLFGNRAPINSFKIKKIISPLTFSNQKLKNLGFKPSDALEKLKL